MSISHLNTFFSAVMPLFLSLLTLLGLSVATSETSFGRCHTELENMWAVNVFYHWFLTQFHIDKRQTMISTPLDVETFTLFYVPGCVPVSSSLLSMWTLNRMSILLLYENCMNLNYFEWIHSAFQVSTVSCFFCIFLLTFESLILKFQLKILIWFKK